MPNTVKFPVTVKFCDTFKEPVIEPPDVDSLVLAASKAACALVSTDVSLLFCVRSTPERYNVFAEAVLA